MPIRNPPMYGKSCKAIVTKARGKSLLPVTARPPTEWPVPAIDSKSSVLGCSDHIDWCVEMTKGSEDDFSSGLIVNPVLGGSQLLAIMFVDASGSCRITRDNENAALHSIGRDMNDIRRLLKEFSGNLCSFRGDGLLVTFGSASSAVRCGIAIQNRLLSEAHPLKFRIGIHVGDTISVDGQPMGDSVNVAARIESMAEPGGILVSRPVYEALRGPTNFRFVSIGTPYLKNIGDDLELFQVVEQREQERPQVSTLQLLGSFSMTTADGSELSVSTEGKALITVLALSTDGRCSREWLQNTIWDSTAEKDRVICLKNAIESLRVSLGPTFDSLLRIAPFEVALIKSAVSCDVAIIRKHGSVDKMPVSDLLENFEIDSKTFNSWLRHQRSLLRSAICLHVPGRLVSSSNATSPYTASPERKSFAIGLLPARTDGGNARANFTADLLTDWLARSIAETEAVEIHDYREADQSKQGDGSTHQFNGPDVMIECRSGSVGDLSQIAINVLRPEDRKLIWSQSVIAEQTEFVGPSGTNVDRFVSYATDAILSMLASGKHMRDPSAHQAAKSAIGAVHRLLTMTGPGLDRVEADIMSAYEIDPKPVYLAWLAYMSTFHVGERYGVRDATFEEQTRALARKALEADPHNALVLGLVAHVHSYVFHEFAFADDLISRALETNPFRSMTWDSAALLYSYTNRPAEAMKAALNARRLGMHSPYRHLFDGACCVASLVNGRFEEAVKYGESVMSVQSEFKAVLRYLAASYGHLGDTEHARSVLRKLIVLEPDISIERLRDDGYPVPSRASAKLIETGLSRIGLPKHI